MTETLDTRDVLALLQSLPGLKVRENEPLVGHVTMGVGGPARWFVRVDAEASLAPLLAGLRRCAADWFVLGGGSNTIFGDNGYPGVVVSLGDDFRLMEPGPEAHMLTAGAAANLSAVMKFAQRQGLAGLEFAAGIPGKLGGALVGNAGTAVGNICSRIAWVDVIDSDGHVVRRPKESIHYGYRDTSLRSDTVIRAALALCPDTPEAIGQRMEQILAKRREQPIGVRCSGCIFKNPSGDHAGRLIDAAGLKGLRIGGAWVSDLHANFILNDGQASSSDIEKLVDTIRERVQREFNIVLEAEIRMVGLDSE